jgi:hypothetical protein
MSISILKNDELNRFEIYSDGELAGFAEFKIENQIISYTHTEIDTSIWQSRVRGSTNQSSFR